MLGQGVVSREGDIMPPTLSLSFGLFQLDPVSGCLWRGEQLMPLPPKPLAVLAYLVTHAGQVVTKDALLAAVWLEVVVTEGVLKTCLRQIRQVLGETAKRPQHSSPRGLIPLTCR
jgi:DNA-binding winged helix-turn-helix (wHTH) protein